MALVDPLYEGKEQSLVKHEMLRRYLSTFAHKVGSWWDSITYVDGFSGPWNSVSADLKDSSFAIAISELRQARETHRAKKNLKLRCFFVEENREAFKQLDDYAKAQTDVEIRPVNVVSSRRYHRSFNS
jgi:three-Cys-motif partner protein